MLRPIFALSATLLMTQTACDMATLATNTTADVMVRAQPAMQQESDYDLAKAALPGTLKTIEGFHIANPENEKLVGLLAEGFCQYGTGFVQDDWEAAFLAGDTDEAAHQAEHATKMFTRCLGYALELLGSSWQKNFYGDLDGVRTMVAAAGDDQRAGMLWAGIGLGSAINLNKTNIAMVAQLPKAKLVLERVVALDDANPPSDPARHALPHIALGTMYTAVSPAMGGKPELGKKHFLRAIEITGGKFLLAKVLYARFYGVISQNEDLFHKTLVEVLQTDPAIWPDQRLANEIAHRKARRYLKYEKEWF
ncbi:MAG TPA: TRAP transporter TatT component family protein [Kofleriaceae bacterium]|nr:TRAP transporter TatT component family protein [Kofleriaceae bacterium]